jgi:hypothetical protein
VLPLLCCHPLCTYKSRRLRCRGHTPTHAFSEDMTLEPCCGTCRYADAGAYAGKFRALQQRALAAVRTRVSAVLRHASEQVHTMTHGGAVCTEDSGSTRILIPSQPGALPMQSLAACSIENHHIRGHLLLHTMVDHPP